MARPGLSTRWRLGRARESTRRGHARHVRLYLAPYLAPGSRASNEQTYPTAEARRPTVGITVLSRAGWTAAVAVDGIRW
jgi:hypothetical protein